MGSSDLMPPEQAVNNQRSRRVIVAAVIVIDGRVLACERSAPPDVAGRWEFPGGKVEPGETDAEALDGGMPRALEHASMRWLGVDELDTVAWLPADKPIVAGLPALLSAEGSA